MKRIWKKIIPCILILTMLFNFSGSTVLATDPMSEEGNDEIMASKNLNFGVVIDGIVGILTTYLRVIILMVAGAFQGILTAIAYADGDQGMIRFCYAR